MSGQYRNTEVEVALLASVPGFFIGGMVNYNRDIVGIVLSSVVTGVVVFFVVYYAMVLVLAGKKKPDVGGEYFEELKAPAAVKKAVREARGRKASVNKGKKVDLVTKGSEDDLFNDIYGK